MRYENVMRSFNLYCYIVPKCGGISYGSYDPIWLYVAEKTPPDVFRAIGEGISYSIRRFREGKACPGAFPNQTALIVSSSPVTFFLERMS